nr:reverse transcriptase domain-containing protein [Tanacetum cinerariifolium]
MTSNKFLGRLQGGHLKTIEVREAQGDPRCSHRWMTSQRQSQTDSTQGNQVTPSPSTKSQVNITMSPDQRDTLVSLLSASPQSNVSLSPPNSGTPEEGNLVRLLIKSLTKGKHKHHSGSSTPGHLRAIWIDMEQFIQWISNYKLPNNLVMPKNISTYKGMGDPDSHVWTFEGAIKTCA